MGKTLAESKPLRRLSISFCNWSLLAEATGKEVSVPKQKVEEKKQSESSLMPDNFGDLLSHEDFNNLMAFLLSKGSKTTAQK